MKKRVLSITFLLSLYVTLANAQSVHVAFPNTLSLEDIVAGYTFPAGSPGNTEGTVVKMSASASGRSTSGLCVNIIPTADAVRFQNNTVTITTTISVATITVMGTSSGNNGESSVRNITSVNGVAPTIVQGRIEGSQSACSQVTVSGFGVIPAGTEIVIIFSNNVRVGQVSLSTESLPLDFLSFTAKPDALGKSVNLNWQTTNEANTKEFIIEKRTDVSEFAAIGTIASKNTAGIHNYSYTDNNAVAGNVYYRLKQVDNDGKYTYSDIVSVNTEGDLSLSVYPNPADKVLNVSHALAQNASIKVLNAEGKVSLLSNVANGATATSIDISKLQKGVYFLIFDDGNKQLRQKFVKN